MPLDNLHPSTTPLRSFEVLVEAARDPGFQGHQEERVSIGTYGHAEDGLLALVNITGGHFDCCERK